MRRLIDSLRAPWGSVGFRLALNYSLFALTTSLLLLAFFYHQTVGVLEAQFSRQVAVTAQRLISHFDQGGLAGLTAEIQLELADHVNSDTEMFLLLDGDGRALAGNIAPDPTLARLSEEGTSHMAVLRGREAHGYLVARSLPDGSRLIVGHDVRDLKEMKRLIKRVSLVATGVTALLVLLGGFLFRRTLQQRVEVIRRTATQVGAGQIKERVPLRHPQDEFALLTHDINMMLDRIEALMDGVRRVSDSVAHHLRTPLSRMLARSRSALRPGTPHGELQGSLAFLAEEIEDLAKVSEKLLQIAELEAGARRKKFEAAELGVIARDVVELYAAVAEAQGSTLISEASSEAVVHGDRDLLAGAIATLVDNALKYAGRGSCIRVETGNGRGDGGGPWIAVRDDGPGISSDKLKRVGERFYRLNRDVPGYGLGLPTVIAIAHLHDATFELDGAQPGLRVRLRFGPA